MSMRRLKDPVAPTPAPVPAPVTLVTPPAGDVAKPGGSGKSTDHMSSVSRQIREAITAVFPAPYNQHLTVMVPGKVVNFDEYKVYGERKELCHKVEINQAILCDDMAAVDNVQLGPTGKSVARLYLKAISKLVSDCGYVGIDKSKMTEEQKVYERGMTYLSTPINMGGSKTTVELYTELQAAYSIVVSAKAQAFREAREYADASHGKDIEAANAAFSAWLDENAFAWRNRVQAAYMNWVVTGRKEEVEFWFAVVDQETAMSRIELSKQIMRAAVVQDEDGSCEYLKVKLDPRNWANLCFEKLKSLPPAGTRTADWYSSEISRLEQHIILLEVLQTNPPKHIVKEDKYIKDALDTAHGKVKTAMGEFIAAKNALAQLGTTPKEKEPEEDTKKRAKAIEDVKAKKKELAEAKGLYRAAQNEANTEALKKAANTVTNSAVKKDGHIGSQITQTRDTIDEYKAAVTYLQKKSSTAEKVSTDLIDTLVIQAKQDKPIADPEANQEEHSDPLADYFTSIHLSVSKSSDHSSTESGSTSFGGTVDAKLGPFGLSVEAEHSEAYASAMKDLASSEVDISFDVMRVDITRPWLFGELFNDTDLRPGPGVKISPGPGQLKSLISSEDVGKKDLEIDSHSFPMYPTAFYVAANIVLDVKGSTSSLHSYMNTFNTSGSAEFSYGPFSASAHFSTSSSKSSANTETTSTGCRITLRSPQIIGWVSTIVPKLPR